jgi:hypothetical protein
MAHDLHGTGDILDRRGGALRDRRQHHPGRRRHAARHLHGGLAPPAERNLAALRALAHRRPDLPARRGHIETAITTDWEAIARVAAIAVIRTFLNYFLEKDFNELREREEPKP